MFLPKMTHYKLNRFGVGNLPFGMPQIFGILYKNFQNGYHTRVKCKQLKYKIVITCRRI